MALTTLDELRDNIAATVRETQITSLITNFLNLTLQEIWDYHPWTFKRRKTTMTLTANQEDYALDEEVDGLALIRERTTPNRLIYLPDQPFYELEPAPEDGGTGTPRYYRLWEETGFKAQLAADGTVYVASSSASDGSSFVVRIVGRNSSGEVVAETLTLNGTTAVTSTTTWDDGGLLQVSKSAATTGTITVSATTGDTVLSELAPEDLAPRYKKISFYPIPSATTTLYLEYWERLRLLVHDADVPMLDKKWLWVLREGALAKTWEYKQNEAATAQHYTIFANGLKTMVRADLRNLDYVPVLHPRRWHHPIVRRYSDSVGDAFPSYGVGH